MTTPTVTVDNLGAWLLRCNPDRWDLPGFVEDGNDTVTSWTVSKNYRSRLMAPGQPVLLWVSGNGRRMARGLWGFGTVTGAAQDYVPEALDPKDADYWLDQEARASADNRVLLDLPIFGSPVSDQDLRASGISDLEVQLQTQGSNPSWVSREQMKRLTPLLPAQPDVRHVDTVTISTTGAGFGTPDQNRIVEIAALDAVRDVYTSDGWEVTDVSASKCGWDLTCSKGPAIDKVEVKGVSGDKLTILLTANELRAAHEEARWKLNVVVRALSAPTVYAFDGTEAISAAKPYLYRASLPSGSAG